MAGRRGETPAKRRTPGTDDPIMTPGKRLGHRQTKVAGRTMRGCTSRVCRDATLFISRNSRLARGEQVPTAAHANEQLTNAIVLVLPPVRNRILRFVPIY
jgi:hypothetical protein